MLLFIFFFLNSRATKYLLFVMRFQEVTLLHWSKRFYVATKKFYISIVFTNLLLQIILQLKKQKNKAV